MRLGNAWWSGEGGQTSCRKTSSFFEELPVSDGLSAKSCTEFKGWVPEINIYKEWGGLPRPWSPSPVSGRLRPDGIPAPRQSHTRTSACAQKVQRLSPTELGNKEEKRKRKILW